MTSRSAVPLPGLLRRLWHHLSHRRRRQFGLLVGVMLVSALAEVVTLGSVLPFLSVLVAPDRVLNHPIIANVVSAWGITSADQLLMPITSAFVAAALAAGGIRILLLWASARLAYASGADLSIEVYRRTLYQPYRVHLARNSSQIIGVITNKVDGTAYVLLQMITLVTSFGLLVALTLALIVISPMLALSAALSFGGGYGFITWFSRRRLHRNSQRIAHELTQVIKALQEGLGGIRDVLLDGTQAVYCDIYQRANYPWRRAQSNNNFIAGSPRYAMEALGIVLIAVIAYGLTLQSGGMAGAVPVLGAFALGAQRILLALQQVYGAWAFVAGNHASVEDTVRMLDQPLPAEQQAAVAPLLFQNAIHFNAVRFRYTSDGPWILDSLDLAIPKGARLGVVGSTGSGKSTMLDVLTGLLTPTEGHILVDGKPISGSRLNAWQRTIAHVPQSIYLADASIAENIAFGVHRDAIDMQRVQQAARQAQIADFVESGAEGYNAYVGERGVRLSGGQRQRIGIARALYKQASVLVFDEATSALDNATEQSVMDAIEKLNRGLTILIIAHRLTTVRRCDTIVELAHGRVVAQGSYEQLLECSPSFRRLALAID